MILYNECIQRPLKGASPHRRPTNQTFHQTNMNTWFLEYYIIPIYPPFGDKSEGGSFVRLFSQFLFWTPLVTCKYIIPDFTLFIFINLSNIFFNDFLSFFFFEKNQKNEMSQMIQRIFFKKTGQNKKCEKKSKK